MFRQRFGVFSHPPSIVPARLFLLGTFQLFSILDRLRDSLVRVSFLSEPCPVLLISIHPPEPQSFRPICLRLFKLPGREAVKENHAILALASLRRRGGGPLQRPACSSRQ